MKTMLQSRLDEETAMALVSSISVKERQMHLTVERMQKCGLGNKELMIAALKQEFAVGVAAGATLKKERGRK